MHANAHQSTGVEISGGDSSEASEAANGNSSREVSLSGLLTWARRCVLFLALLFTLLFLGDRVHGEWGESPIGSSRIHHPPTCASTPARHAFVFYAKRPPQDLLDFAAELSERTPFGVYVVVDDETYVWADAWQHTRVRLVSVPTSHNLAANITHAASYHFHHNRPANLSVWAHDRALLLATSDDFTKRYCRVWLIEDDVFIPSVQAALHVDQLAGDYDYVSTSDISMWPVFWDHWQQFNASLSRLPIPPQQWRHNMMNAIGLSTRFLALVRSFAEFNGQLVYSEAMFPTFALHFNLTHLPLDSLRMLWRTGVNNAVNFEWERVGRTHTNPALTWLHPMKNQTLRRMYRQQLRAPSRFWK